MRADVAIFEDRSKRRADVTCRAMLAGITAVGDRVVYRSDAEYRQPDTATAVIYGMGGSCHRVLTDYVAQGRTVVCIDLGYWCRRGGTRGRWKGFHKVSINSRHPTAYFQRVKHDSRRADAMDLKVEDWRREGKHILVAGMGPKAAAFERLGFEEWERGAIRDLKERTDRPIVYRPKPNAGGSINLEGVGFTPEQELADAFAECHAIVTHHSNVAVDALLAGIPTFCWDGVAKPLSLQDLRLIETPFFPEDRRQFANDVAYTQFSVSEMTEGVAWRHLKDEGLVP